MPDDPYNLTEMSLCVHNGTHVDAPRHFIADGPGVGDLPLDVFFGECTAAAWNGDISPILACCSERLLLMGSADITPESALAIARSHVRLVGVESQSAGPSDAPEAVHKILLGSGVVLLEGLVFSQVEPGSYILSAFPLNLGAECDGSPVRAVLISTVTPSF
jgi:arylformamidase